MKKVMAALALSAVVSVSGAFAADGGQIFQSKGCGSCHQANVDTVGPSLKKIAATYKGKEADLVKFLKGQGKAIVDPAKAGIMTPQLNQLKGLSDAEIKALADFMLKH